MRVLITGINGFIGKHLANKLIERGHQVSGLGRGKKGVVNKKLVEKAVRNVDVVIHLAALTSHKDIVDNKFKTLEINLQGTKNVLDAFSKSERTRKFLYASTGKVYGKIVRLPITETHPTSPLNVLGKSKLLTEKLVDFYATSKKEFVIFRIFNVYGEGQGKNFLIPTILKQLEKGNTLNLGDTKAKRDYVYIDDVVNAFELAIEKKGTMGLSTYNICTGKNSSASEIVRLISKIKGVKIKVKSDSKKLRHDEMDSEYGSFAKAKKAFGWEPKINFEQGLEKLIDQNKMQAVILAGGKGTRMQKRYPGIPKLLIPLKGKPFIDHLIDHLKNNAVNNIIICAGFLGDKVKKYIEQKDYGVKIRISIEKELLGTGGALNLIKDFLEKDFFLFYGDVYTTINLRKMYEFHKKKKAMVSAAIHPSAHPVDSDLIEFDRNFRLTKILVKPHTKIPKNPYNLASLYVVSPSIRKYLKHRPPYDFEHDLLTKLLDENIPIYGYNTDELMMDIGTPERLAKAEKLLHK